ncbi:hypothetical protein B0H19DRAFT_1067092 [Mycena capillaripes]|nr:hypothetical protein B0H19DRAFT_1067092 [Mycena capillaripes]
MDSYDNNVNTNSVYGTDGTDSTRRDMGGDFNNTGSTGLGNNQNDRFESSNTSGGYGQQDRFDNTGSNTGTGMTGSNMGTGMTGSNMGTGMNDSSFGSTQRTDDLSTGGTGYGTGGDFGSSNRDEFGTGNRDEFEGHGKPSMGDKIKGGAEKLAGKMTGNTGMQERGQERKMGEFERNSEF